MLAGDVVATTVDIGVASTVDEGPAPMYGDANSDGVFDQLDLLQVLREGKYNTGEIANWSQGDWNGDSVFDQLDIVGALQAGNFQHGSRSSMRADRDHTDEFTKGGNPANPPLCFQNPGTCEVSATLVRTNNGISLHGSISGLNPTETYTLWWLIDDNPNGEFNPADASLIMNATGGITNQHGELNFAAGLNVGNYDENPTQGREVLLPGAFDDPRGAEVVVHFVGHGEPIPGQIPDQISKIANPTGFAAEIIFTP